MGAERIQRWLSRMHFATEPVGAMGGWVPDLLRQWNSTIYQLTVEVRAMP